MPLTLFDVGDKIRMPKRDVLNWMQEFGLIPEHIECKAGHRNMQQVYSSTALDKFIWQCSNCHENRSVRKGTWFEKSKLNMEQIILLTYMWIYELPEYIRPILGLQQLSTEAISDWYNYCQQTCLQILLKHLGTSEPMMTGCCPRIKKLFSKKEQKDGILDDIFEAENIYRHRRRYCRDKFTQFLKDIGTLYPLPKTSKK